MVEEFREDLAAVVAEALSIQFRAIR